MRLKLQCLPAVMSRKWDSSYRTAIDIKVSDETETMIEYRRPVDCYETSVMNNIKSFMV